ncbi:MAG: C69 family dipeptidase [Bacteroidetes bacterium]|nr:C69 family dipeptidase [Bacteroidota bacterium]
MKNRSLFLLPVILLVLGSSAYPCTNLLITKGASKDGSVMIAYTADSHVLYGELYFRSAADYPEGALRDVYDWDSGKFLGRIKQVRHTYSGVGNMNEHQVSLGETTYGGREELQEQPDAVVDYGSLMYIALERARSAREAIKIMTDLVAEYGYGSEGESFSVSDANEAWILEMIGKGKIEKGAVWVARRIPDGYICGHANQARIQTFPLNDPENCLYSKDVITFARKMGYYNGTDQDFSFSDTYNPVEFGGARFCEARVWSIFRRVNKDMDKYTDYAQGINLKNRMPLWVKPDQKVTLHEAMNLMRDHYEGTPLDMMKDLGGGPFYNGVRWRPMTWKIDSVDYFNERAISTQQTGFFFVAQSRSWLPDAVGGVNWFGVDDSYTSLFTPMYSSMTRVPHSYAVGNGSMMEFSDDAAFWVFNQVSNFAYTRYKDIMPEIRKIQQDQEEKYIMLVEAMDQSAKDLYKKDPALAVEFLTNFSVTQGDYSVKRWKDLYHYLFTKYLDGNIKEKDGDKQNPKLKQPGYGEEWYRLLIRETGDRFKTPKPKK